MEGGAWELKCLVKALESGCPELRERERKWRKEQGESVGGWEPMEGWCWDAPPPESATPLQCRGEKRPQGGQWLPQGHMDAEELRAP